MKRILHLFMLTFFCITSTAQRVDLDKYSFTASYRDLPRGGLDTSYRTFSIRFDAGSFSRMVLRNEELQDLVYIEGWKKLSYDAHIQVDTKIEDLFIERTDIKQKVDIIKDKNGNEIGKKTSYYVQAIYTYAAQAKITDYRGRHIETFTLASRANKQTHNSSTFPSEAEASAYARFGYLLMTNNLIKLTADNVVNYLNNTLSYNYGFPDRFVNDFLWILGSKKHPEYSAHRRAWVTFKSAMIRMSFDEPLDEVKEMMKPVIDYFTKMKKLYSSGDKPDRKMRYASCFNLAKIYYYLDDPDAAMREASELVMNGYDAKDGTHLESAATNLKQLFRQSKMQSRHFSVMPEAYEGPQVMSSSFY